MIRLVKDFVQKFLKKYNYQIIYLFENQIIGLNFERDIKILVEDEKPICFDVGANTGQTIDLFQKIFKEPQIYSFEPSTESFKCLQAKNYGPNVYLYDFALGDHNSQQEFINFEGSTLSSFLALDMDEENPFRDVEVKYKEVVNIKTIDWFIQQNNIPRVDILKIDTQGYDLQVLKGAKDSLEKGLIKNIFIEINFVKLYKNQSNRSLISDFLADHNIHLVDLYEKVRNYKTIRDDHTLMWCTALFSKRSR